MKTRRITWFVLTLILAMGMIGSSVLASTPEHDNNLSDTNRMHAYDQGGTATDPTIAKIHLNKQHCATNFKGIENFNFKITKVGAWRNDNTSTALNGQAQSEIPGFNGTKANDEGTATATVAQNGAVTDITLGKYNEKNTSAGDTATARTRGVTMQFGPFNKAGYYVYEVEEITDDAQEKQGVTYDKDKYYLVVYVANMVDSEDNTTEGTYVHSITRWNKNGKDTPESIVENLNKGTTYDADRDMGTNDDVTKNGTTDKTGGSKDAGRKDNTEKKDSDIYGANDSEAGKEEISKEGKPNEIEVHFDNKEAQKSLEVTKNVTGTLGDLTKEFEYTVELNVADAPATFPVTGTYTGDVTFGSTGTGTARMITLTEGGKAIEVTQAGKILVQFKLKDNQNLQIAALPVGTTYTITEAASDHTPSFKVKTEGMDYTVKGDENVDEWNAKYVVIEEGVAREATATDFATAGKVIKYAKVLNPAGSAEKNNACALTGETVDVEDGDITVAYTNHRDITTETGIPGFVFPIVLIGMIALIGLAVVRRRSNVATVNDFEF